MRDLPLKTCLRVHYITGYFVIAESGSRINKEISTTVSAFQQWDKDASGGGMIPGFERIVEDRIKKAQYKGAFKNLPGAGEPLNLVSDQHIPQDLRLAYKILKNADCLPPEIELKKQIQRTEELLTDMHDTCERYRTMKKLNYLILKLNSTRKQDARFDMPQQYEAAVADRIGSHSKKQGL